MKMEITPINGIPVAEVISNDIVIRKTQDALDIMADATYQGSSKIIIREENIIPDFFDLKTGFAGEVLQKFSTYNVQLAIIGDFSKYTSKSLKDFIYESNKYRRINFVGTMDEAINSLTK